MLNSKVTLKLSFLTNVGDGISINEGLNTIALGDDAKVIPLAFFDRAFVLCKPATKTDSVYSARSFTIDLDLITFRSTFFPRATECEAGIKPWFHREENL